MAHHCGQIRPARPRLVWFYFDGADIVVYSQPSAAKVRHIRNHPRVSLNLDSDGNGSGIIALGGDAIVDAEDSDRFGLTEAMGGFNLRLRISVDKVWTTPTEA